MQFPKRFLQKEKICKAIYLYEIEDLIRSRLSPSNMKILEGEMDLKEQMFKLYWNNRFFTSLPKERVLEQVNNCIDAYKFLLDSSLDPERIKRAFMKALMDVISLGSGTYFLYWDSWYNKHYQTKDLHGTKGSVTQFLPKRHKYWKIFRFAFKQISEIMKQKYSSIPYSIRFSEDLVRGVGMKEMENRYPFSEQLLVSFSYPLFLLHIKRKINIAEFEKEFFNKHRWCLERLSSCNPILLNKYREEMCKEISYDLGLDPDPSYFRYGYFQNNLTFPPRDIDYLDRISKLIVSYFADYELELFREIDSSKSLWNFSDQIKDRYYSKYPSLAPFDEIEKCIKEKGSEYRVLLETKNAEIIREVLLDEIEQVAFISKPTHLWNLEMMRNLKKGKIRNNKKITKAVDLILAMLPKGSIEFLHIRVFGSKYSLREQLLARWQRAWLASNLKAFRNYLNTMHIYTTHSIDALNNRSTLSKVDLQALLEKVDMFFLYPNRGRFIKKIFRRLDTGKTISKMLEKFRASVSYLLYIDVVLLTRYVLFLTCLIAWFYYVRS